MSIIHYKCKVPADFSLEEKRNFVELLHLQGHVLDPTIDTIENCRMLCAGIINDRIVAIGAIKPSMSSDFRENNPDLPDITGLFDLEVDYFYTHPDHTRTGYGSAILQHLIRQFHAYNLMACTEEKSKNPMVSLLEKSGFNKYGISWKFGYSTTLLNLYLRFSQQQ